MLYKANKITYKQMILAESPVWDAANNSLWCTDIEEGTLHHIHMQKSAHEHYKIDRYLGCVVPANDGRLLCCTQDNIVMLCPSTGKMHTLVSLGLPSHLRLNDGKCDMQGRLWVGSMDMHPKDGTKPQGKLYCYDGTQCKEKLHELSISNGLAWSGNGKWMYHIDTPTGKVMEYEFDPASGNLGSGRVCAEIPQSLGVPDGMTVDTDGMLWVAVWGGGCVVQINPHNGVHMSTVELETKNASSCCFGGQNMDTLYITTAQDNTGHGGQVYACPVQATGHAPATFNTERMHINEA